MTIFAIFRVSHPDKMRDALARVFPNNHLQVKDDEWLLSASGTARDVSDKLGVTPGNDTGGAIIFSMANYYGRSDTQIWEWIKAKAEQSGG